MSSISRTAFRYTVFAMRILSKILGSKFSVTGIEKLPKHPVLFVANHFTRSETFFVPYLIYKNTQRQVRCLADSGLYHGILGRFLESVGTISTKHKNRDNVILKDLITGNNDWMIYPEGSMLKSKEIKNDYGFVNYTPHRVGPIRTGSAILALKSQVYRSDLIEAYQENDAETLKYFQEFYGISYSEDLLKLNTHIVPINITYYPLRPGENKIQQLIAKLVNKIPKQISEELEIEGNLLLNAEINVHIGDPIDLKEYIKNARNLIYQIPIIKSETKSNLILRYFKHRLTNEFMSKIYSDIEINFDHIFGAILYHFKESEIRISHLKRLIYLSALMISRCKRYRTNHSINEADIYKIFLDEPNEIFDSVFALAKDQGLIEEIPDARIKINKKIFIKKCDFHEIRRENSLQVITNEFLLLDMANEIVKSNIKIPDDKLRKRVFLEIHQMDLKNYNDDYEAFFDEKFSKDKTVGSPFFLDSNIRVASKIKRIGILVSHGYKSAPLEVEPLAKFFNGFGFKVYATRLKGHGTAPINLRDVTFEEWYDSMQRGYAALRNICTKIIVVGFSTGGLLGLLAAARKNNNSKLEAVISINAAIKLLDIKARMVPGINIWNEMLEKLHIEKGRFEYVDDHPEKPAINYSRNYLKAVEQLEKLMHVCEESLGKISAKTLVIQASHDPVVNPISGKIIYDKIKSKEKFLANIDLDNHVIINCQRQEEVFEVIGEFLYKLKFL
jgi:esterase/lipase/1-acyl-sn-glycerol-3-phosphate acyltransferase